MDIPTPEQITTTTPTKEWTHQDEGDCTRLVTEMQEDAKWQLQLFTFALRVTAIIFGVISKVDSGAGGGMPGGLVFLSPLIVPVPTSLRPRGQSPRGRRVSSAHTCVLPVGALHSSPNRAGPRLRLRRT